MEKSFQLHLDIAQAALREADPERLILGKIFRRGSELLLSGEGFSLEGPGLVLGLGKAAGKMLRAMQALLEGVSCEWLCVTKDHHLVPDGVPHRFAGHPVPDERSVQAAEEILQRAQRLSEQQGAWLLLLLSGGASALACAPVDGVSLEDKQDVTRLLLSSGLEISKCNVVRSALSRFKGGGLARALGEARSACIILSDVVRGGHHSVGSGPLLGTPNMGLAKEILTEAKLWERLPLHVQRGIEAPRPVPKAQTIRKSALWEQLPPHVQEGLRSMMSGAPLINHLIVGSRFVLWDGVCRALSGRSLPRLLHDAFSESVEELVLLFLEYIHQIQPGESALVLGEPTLTVEGDGLGGRAQHTALMMAKALSERPGLSFLAMGSDGTDGPTDAAGAIIDAHTWRRLSQAGADPEGSLQRFDSYHALDRVGALLRTGPTGTNVNDLYLLLREDLP